VISFQYAPIFFQAVGRDEKEKGREDAGRTRAFLIVVQMIYLLLSKTPLFILRSGSLKAGLTRQEQMNTGKQQGHRSHVYRRLFPKKVFHRIYFLSELQLKTAWQMKYGSN